MMRRQTLLITGASGLLGWNVCHLAKNDFEVWGTYFAHELEIPGVNLCRVDLTNTTEIKRLFARVGPDAVVHCAAVSSPNFCQENKALSFKMNVEASECMARLCREYGSAMVFTSSGQIFDGTHAPYKETDPPNPLNVYGEHKLLAEERIRQAHPEAVVCRMPLMFGYGGPCGQSFIQPWIRSIQTGQALTLFTDEIRAPVSGLDAAQGLLHFIGSPHKVLHLGGRDAMSRYEMGRRLFTLLQSPENSNACRQADVQMTAQRPGNITFDSSLAFANGYDPRPLKETFPIEVSKILEQ